MRFHLVAAPVILAVLWALVLVQSLDFQFPNFTDAARNQLILSSNSYIAEKAIQVTPDSHGASMANMSGRVLYRWPFRLWSIGGKKASFNTTFVLNIKNMTPSSGEGLAFILTAYRDVPVGSEGQWLGIVNPTLNGSMEARTATVEFDTGKSFPDDLDDNHIGLDVNSVYSRTLVSLNGRNIYISSGNDCWNISHPQTCMVVVRYDNKNLTVFVGEDKDNPVLSGHLNLSSYLPEAVYVGFRAQQSWEFIGSEIEDSKLRWVWILVAAGSVLILLISTGIGAIFLHRKRGCKVDRLDDASLNFDEAILRSSIAPRNYKFKELGNATGNFNRKNKPGKGGFGTVYKGILGNKEVIVKRVSKKSTQGKREFMAEVTTIGNLHHRNLVKLIGWCHERREYLLVYEYLPNGSLDKYIFCDEKPDTQKATILSWEKRRSVISGVAHALDYLHIKASNIMLDLDFNAKLGDFGLARTIIRNEHTHHSTKELAGTPGYMAPESILTRRATAETDVYAFGVLVLEVACGRKPGGQTERDDYISNIVHELWELYRRGTVLKGRNGASACCHPNPNDRPSMKIVLEVLTGEAPLPDVPVERPVFMWPPKPPSFTKWDSSIIGDQLSPISELAGR
ncbi:L-type lectin-domain containing receptor kinase [Salix suchowensis]|nr:L-type lectin-domain containing receptor kinase [Salix suchowensis]